MIGLKRDMAAFRCWRTGLGRGFCAVSSAVQRGRKRSAIASPPLLSASRFTAGAAGFLTLIPVSRSAGTVRRAEPLLYDTFAARFASVLVNDRAIAVVVRIECDAVTLLAQQFR